MQKIHFSAQIASYGANQALFKLSKDDKGNAVGLPEFMDTYASASGDTLEVRQVLPCTNSETWQDVETASVRYGVPVSELVEMIKQWATSAGESFTAKAKFLTNIAQWEEKHPDVK